MIKNECALNVTFFLVLFAKYVEYAEYDKQGNQLKLKDFARILNLTKQCATESHLRHNLVIAIYY